MKKGRREFVQGITLSAATALSRRVPAATRKQPNIVFILSLIHI